MKRILTILFVLSNMIVFSQNVRYQRGYYKSSTGTYGKGKDIYQGSRGGQYYINDNSNKVYVPKRHR